MATLTARERAHLKARAHALEPVVQTGSSGVTDTLVAEVERALTAHELIKVKVNADDRADRIAIGDEIARSNGERSGPADGTFSASRGRVTQNSRDRRRSVRMR